MGCLHGGFSTAERCIIKEKTWQKTFDYMEMCGRYRRGCPRSWTGSLAIVIYSNARWNTIKCYCAGCVCQQSCQRIAHYSCSWIYQFECFDVRIDYWITRIGNFACELRNLNFLVLHKTFLFFPIVFLSPFILIKNAIGFL